MFGTSLDFLGHCESAAVVDTAVAAVGGGVVAVIAIFIGAAAYTIWWYYLPTRGQREIYRLYPFIDTRWLKVDFPFY